MKFKNSLNIQEWNSRFLISLPLLTLGFVIIFWGVSAWTSLFGMMPSLRYQADIELLKKHVYTLASQEKPRNYQNFESLEQAAQYIQRNWQSLGLEVEHQPYTVAGKQYKNLIVSLGPREGERIVVGAHYDVCENQPGADDNASGVAGLLELTRLLVKNKAHLEKRIDLVAYTLEEPPYFETEFMGSAVHARSLKEQGVKVKVMLSLEMIGYFSDQPNSQSYPVPALKWIYPTTGNFIAMVGSLKEFTIVRKLKYWMNKTSPISVRSLTSPQWIEGMDYSDHRNYWAHGYPAIMVTDTAFLRNHNYHEPTDTPDTLNYEKMAEVVNAIYGGVAGIAQ